MRACIQWAMGYMRNGWVAGLALGLAGSCSSGPGLAERQIVLQECGPSEGLRDALCGRVRVFEDRDRGAGRTLDLRVVVYPAAGRSPQPDPLFVLAGGPGQSAVQLSPMIARVFRGVRQDRDLVFVDQRGTGDSNGLTCEFDTDDLGAALKSEAVVRRMQQCLAEYEADVRHYTTPVAMDDLDEVRAQLGYARVNIWGGSYGTRAALVYLRRHGRRVRSLVLDGAVPLGMKLPLAFPEDAQRAFALTLDACEAEPACHQHFPDLRRQATELLDRLQRRPMRVELKHPRSGEQLSLDLNRDMVAPVLRGALYDPTAAATLPLLIDQAHRGEFKGLLALAVTVTEPPEEAWMSLGMFFSVVCAEDLPWTTRAERRRRAAGTFLGASIGEAWSEVCATWPQGAVGEDYHNPVRSDVPALVLSGALDPVTPPRWGEVLAQGLSAARHVIVPGAGHGVSGAGCVPSLIEEFLRDGSANGLAPSCVEDWRRPPFFVTPAGPAMAEAE